MNRLSFFLLVIVAGLLQRGHAGAQVMHKELHFVAGASLNLLENTLMNSIDAGIDFSEKPWGSMGGALTVYKFWDTCYSALGLGLRLPTRIFFVKRYGYSIFTEVKGGVMYMFGGKRGNNLNFTFLCGFGTDIKVSKHAAIKITFDYSHFSNGKRNGSIINPTWDGTAACFGYVYTIN